MSQESLPILGIRNEFAVRWCKDQRVVVTAPTGAGKSTQIPQFLLDDRLVDGTVMVLEPRRLAARMLAMRVAAERGGQVGDEVGVVTRFERRISEGTRLVFVTEGVLLRRLLSDPGLSGVGAVVFDEFHERSLMGDVALGLVRTLQERRGDLGLIVMSATLAHEPLQAYLGGCLHVHAEGRIFPIDISYLKRPMKDEIWDAAAASLSELLTVHGSEMGDVLIFMPGVHEIRKTAEACRRLRMGEQLEVLPLFGDMSRDAQQEVMRPCVRRKIIVATNIAETSLTIPGVRHVIDSGMARLNQHDPGRGINMLTLVPISRDSADQRSGRSGREGPGSCRRLWTLAEHQRKAQHTVPEVLRVDLCETLLLLKGLGFTDIEHFPWFLPPRSQAVTSALDTLVSLRALDTSEGALTRVGRDLLKVPAHPRLAMLCRASAELGCCSEATLIAAILNERPFLHRGKPARNNGKGRGKGGGRRDARYSNDRWAGGAQENRSDLVYEMRALREAEAKDCNPRFCSDNGIIPSAARSVLRTATFLRGVFENIGWIRRNDPPGEADNLAKCILQAFPDHLGQRCDKGTLNCELRGGRHATLARESTVRTAQSETLVAAEIREVNGGDRDQAPILSRVTEIKEEWLIDLFPDDWAEEDDVVWDEGRRRVCRREVTSCLGVPLLQRVSADVPAAVAANLLAGRIRESKLPLAGWGKETDAWISRVRWVANFFPERGLTLYDDDDMAVIMREFCTGETAYAGIKKKAVFPYIQNALSWDDIQFVEAMAPAFFALPSGTRMKLSYGPDQGVRGRARIQDLYGQDANPHVAAGRARVLLEILAPNMRTVQITDDISRFWSDIYPKAKQELARRYPKHEWR